MNSMTDFRITFEWLDSQDCPEPELKVTFAELSILVDRYCVTRLYDEQSRTMREVVYVPLYPLAEWVAANWWALWKEPEMSGPMRPGYLSRHSLVGAREGYALPPLRIEAAGSLTRLSWHPEDLPFNKVRFTETGQSWVPTDAVKNELSSLVAAVVSRLESQGITGTMLQEDWLAVQGTDTEQKVFCECAAALGLDPYDLDDSQQRAIEDIGHRLPEEIVNEFFGAARSEELHADAQVVLDGLARTQRNTLDLTSLKDLRQTMATWTPPAGTPPWEQGYSFARELRCRLGLDGLPLDSIEAVGKVLEVTASHLDAARSTFASHTPFAALMGINDKSSPGFVLRKTARVSQNFHFCRALFEYLWSPTSRSALITDALTKQQKRNRAFASELLAPSSALKKRVRRREVDSEQVDEIAEEFGVSTFVILHQLDNHDIAQVRQA